MKTSLLSIVVGFALLPVALVQGLGGEKAAYKLYLDPATGDLQVLGNDDSNPSDTNDTETEGGASTFYKPRQNVCDRVQKVSSGELELKDALSGLSISSLSSS